MSINKNYIMAGILATACVVPLSDTKDSYASEIRITTDRVNFRTGEGTNYSSIGVLDKGTKVAYISENGNWTKVEYNSKTGYICSDYLQKEQSSSTTNIMYVTPDVGVNMRKGASTSYAVIKTLPKATQVTVHSTSNGWSKITVNGVQGYVSSQYLSITKPSTDTSSSNESNSTTSTMYVTPDDGLNMRKGAGTNYSVITKLSKGTQVTVHSTSDGWSKITVNGVQGYVSSQYLSSTKPSTDSTESIDSNGSTSASVNEVISFTTKQLGKAYVWGAQGPNSFDCSGLTYYVYKNSAGITLPRTSSEQSKYGTTVSKSNLQPGDLVFFDTSGSNNGVVSHVGIYAGNGQMIHSSSSQGKVVQVSIETSYWNNAYVTAKRIL